MQDAGEGRDLSITFQTSGKAVRLSAPEKWRKAIAGEDLKPDSWVEIHRQGGSPQTVRAHDVPELHDIFFDLGLVAVAPPTEAEVVEPQEPVQAPVAENAAEAPVTPVPVAAPGETFRPATAPPTAGARRNRRTGGIVVTIIVLVVLANMLRVCGGSSHRAASLAPSPAVLPIAVDSSVTPAPASSAAPLTTGPADGAAATQTDPGQSTQGTTAESGTPETASGPSFDCSRVTSENLKLICATPDLAAADRALAAAYRQALAATSDTAALRDGERAWIVARNNAPTDADQLRALYAERIQILRSIVAGKAPEPF